MHKKQLPQSPEVLVEAGRGQELTYAVYMMKLTLTPQINMPQTVQEQRTHIVERDMFDEADDLLKNYNPRSFTPARHEPLAPETVVRPIQDSVADEMEQLALQARRARDEAYNSSRDNYGLTA